MLLPLTPLVIYRHATKRVNKHIIITCIKIAQPGRHGLESCSSPNGVNFFAFLCHGRLAIVIDAKSFFTSCSFFLVNSFRCGAFCQKRENLK